MKPNQTTQAPPFDEPKYLDLLYDKHTTISITWPGSFFVVDAMVRPQSKLRDTFLNPHQMMKNLPASFVTDDCPRCGARLEKFTSPADEVYYQCCGFAIHHDAWLRKTNTRDAEPNAYSPPAESNSVTRDTDSNEVGVEVPDFEPLGIIEDDEEFESLGITDDDQDDENTQPVWVFDPVTGITVQQDTGGK